jgi:hypothetical protein
MDGSRLDERLLHRMQLPSPWPKCADGDVRLRLAWQPGRRKQDTIR